MKYRVHVTLKSGVLDPQGKAIEGALKTLGFSGVGSVRQGKVFDVELLSHRLLTVRRWVVVAEGMGDVSVGLFGASTGAAVALLAFGWWERRNRALAQRSHYPWQTSQKPQ